MQELDRVVMGPRKVADGEVDSHPGISGPYRRSNKFVFAIGKT